MSNTKTDLIQKMEQQRFLPISKETISLYRVYESMIDLHDPDELSYLHFYKGEYFFRIGDLRQSLKLLTRCVHAPKSASLKYLDALAYNIIGLIYNYLGQENIAITFLLLAKSLAGELHLAREAAVCCANLGQIYSQIDSYEIALSYYNQAFEYAKHSSNDAYNLKVSCYACCGILYCKLDDYEKALHMADTIKSLTTENDYLFYDVSVISLNIRLANYLDDEPLLLQHFNKLLEFGTSHMEFLEFSDFYFDICRFFLETGYQAECDAIFKYIYKHIEDSTLVFLRHKYYDCRISYAERFLDEKAFLKACSQLISLLPDYQEEQRFTKLYSLDYIERLHQAKNDSALFQEKSRIDQMTGLLNKYTIQYLAEEDLAKSSPAKCSAMLLVDLDHFKQINDTLGHLTGDALIRQTSSVIQNYFKEDALCGRIGGDEFLIYISNVTDPSFVMLQAEMLRQELNRQTSGHNIKITPHASIGIAFSSEYRYDYETIFSAADSALYRAKLDGRNKIVVAE